MVATLKPSPQVTDMFGECMGKVCKASLSVDGVVALVSSRRCIVLVVLVCAVATAPIERNVQQPSNCV